MSTLFSVWDSKAEIFGNPFSERTDATARRAFVGAVADEVSAIHRSPDDYSLFKLGEFDDTTGALRDEPSPIRICTGTEALIDLRRSREIQGGE